MFKFLAMRIHEGKLKIEAVSKIYREKVREAYKEMYGEDLK